MDMIFSSMVMEGEVDVVVPRWNLIFMFRLERFYIELHLKQIEMLLFSLKFKVLFDNTILGLFGSGLSDSFYLIYTPSLYLYHTI